MGAHKWLMIDYIEDITEFYKNMKKQGYQIVVTALADDAKDFRQVDYTKPTLIVVGNELDGISEESFQFADEKVIIPMYGMSQSLNVSVATAVMLYEAQRQRQAVGMYNKPTFPKDLMKKILYKWAYEDIIRK
jgi:tRNA (guanosine-2'-O-)-methyltransferase